MSELFDAIAAAQHGLGAALSGDGLVMIAAAAFTLFAAAYAAPQPAPAPVRARPNQHGGNDRREA